MKKSTCFIKGKIQKRIYIASLMVLIGSIAFAQGKWTLRQPQIGPRGYVAIRMVDSLHGYAIGEAPTQNAVTINGGKYWARTRVKVVDRNSWLYRTSFPTPKIGFISYANDNRICRVSNNGLSVDSLPKCPTQVWDIWFADSLNGYYLFFSWDEISLYRTTTGGQSWNFVKTMNGFYGGDPRIEGRTMSDVWICTKVNVIRSIDSGITWDSVNAPFRKRVVDKIEWLNPQTCFVFSDSSQYYKSLDGGITWAKGGFTSPVFAYNEKILQMEFANTNVGFARMYNGGFFRTTNGGTSWNSVSSKILNNNPGQPIYEAIGPFHVVNENEIWVSTQMGSICKSTDGGLTWKKQTKGTNQSLVHSCLQSSNRAWAVGGNVVINTQDRGRSWNEVEIDTASYYSKVIFPKPYVGYIMANNKIFRTINGGKTWTSCGPIEPWMAYYIDMQFLNADSGFVSTNNGIYVTQNKGQTWTLRTVWNTAIAEYGPKFCFSDFNHGFLIVNEFDKPKTYRTNNNGQSWTRDSLTWHGGTLIGEIHFEDTLKGTLMYGWLQFGGTSGYFKTFDGGATWLQYGLPAANGLRGLFYGGEPDHFYTTTYPELYMETQNGGGNWTVGDTAEIPFGVTYMSFFKRKPCLIVGVGGGIYTSNDWTGQDDYVATGKVVQKQNNDCVQDNNEVGIPYQYIQADPGPYFSSTEPNGRYILNMDTGSYAIRQISSTPVQVILSTQYCPGANLPIPLTVDGLLDTIANNNFINDVKLCPILVLTASQQRLRPCMKSNLVLTIQNQGNVDSDSEFVHVRFPNNLHFKSSAQAYSYNANDSTYRFKIKPLQPFESVSLSITDSVSCNPTGLIGQILCVKANIPNVPNCLLQSPGWDGSDLEVASRCTPTSQTRFTVRNKGASMPSTLQYKIFIDSALVYQSNFQLAANGSMTITLPANAPAGFARLVVPQSANHPLSTFASAEANCALGLSTNGMFPPPDESPLVDVECVAVTNAVDPNDKQVFPTGWGTAGNVEPETEFKYTIRFQNTGTDTAFKVVLVDSLDSNLDIASLQIGSSSHSFAFKVSGKGRPVLSWTFDNIMLPDSSRNQLGSNGFVSFSIRPKTGLALGTRLENFADIYFDFNDPVRTNTTLNTLWRPTLVDGILDTVFVTASKSVISSAQISIYPNPTKGKLELNSTEPGLMTLYSTKGEAVWTTWIKAGHNAYNLAHLPKGLYLVQLQFTDRQVGKKLILE